MIRKKAKEAQLQRAQWELWNVVPTRGPSLVMLVGEGKKGWELRVWRRGENRKSTRRGPKFITCSCVLSRTFVFIWRVPFSPIFILQCRSATWLKIRAGIAGGEGLLCRWAPGVADSWETSPACVALPPHADPPPRPPDLFLTYETDETASF